MEPFFFTEKKLYDWRILYMKELEMARKGINEIDQNMAELFEKRMNLVVQVANCKKKNGMPVYDSSREKQVIERCVQFIKNIDLQPYYVQFLQNLMDVSKKYQHKLLEGARIAYSGIEGAFANIAAKKIFPDGALVPYSDFESAYKSVENGECDVAVLPIENSFAGEVGQVSDLMFTGSLFVNGVYALSVTHNLLGVRGATVKDIKTVVSHPQALDQCASFIKKYGFEQRQAVNTARAAQEVASLHDSSVAAIASEETAELYNLEVLAPNIHENPSNTTRFAVFSKVKEEIINAEDYSTFIMMFVVKNESGSLVKVLQIIGNYGYNLRVVRSRPLKDSQWEYYFYVEAEGKLSSDRAKEMLSEISEKCQMLKVLGSYELNKKLK